MSANNAVTVLRSLLVASASAGSGAMRPPTPAMGEADASGANRVVRTERSGALRAEFQACSDEHTLDTPD